jgi:hypothetical protein
VIVREDRVVLPARRRPRYDLPSRRYGTLETTITALKYGAAVVGGLGFVVAVLLARAASDSESGDAFAVFLAGVAISAVAAAILGALGHGLQLLADIADATTVSATEASEGAKKD